LKNYPICHPELAEGSRCEANRLLPRDSSTPLRMPQFFFKASFNYFDQNMWCFISNNLETIPASLK